METGPSLAGLASGAAEEALKQIADKITDPDFYEALSPARGLEVTPHIFSSVEQEGRWKQGNWGYTSPGRDLSNRIIGDREAAQELINPFDPAELPAEKKARSFTLFAVKIDKLMLPESILMGIAASIVVPIAGGGLKQLLMASSVGDDNVAAVDVTWWDDKLEIWGGFAGLAPGAVGFGSVFGHQAKIEVTGCTYGNYLPARYLIVAHGWINPVGPQYYEFHCGAVICAGSNGFEPLFGEVWDRDGNIAPLDQRKDASPAFSFEITDWLLKPSLLGP